MITMMRRRNWSWKENAHHAVASSTSDIAHVLKSALSV